MPVLIPKGVDPYKIKPGDIIKYHFTYDNGDEESYTFKVTRVSREFIEGKHVVVPRDTVVEGVGFAFWYLLSPEAG